MFDILKWAMLTSTLWLHSLYILCLKSQQNIDLSHMSHTFSNISGNFYLILKNCQHQDLHVHDINTSAWLKAFLSSLLSLCHVIGMLNYSLTNLRTFRRSIVLFIACELVWQFKFKDIVRFPTFPSPSILHCSLTFFLLFFSYSLLIYNGILWFHRPGHRLNIP